MLRFPYFIRKFISKHRRRLPPTAPVQSEDGIVALRSRLAHQERQLAKWNNRLKFGTHGGMGRVEVKKMRDDIAAKIPYWQDRILEAENQ